MSLFPCTACGERPAGKLANVTLAWWPDGRTRVAYRHRLCMTCYCTHILPLDVPEGASVLTCPACHIDTTEGMSPLYVTSFLPGVGKTQLELPMCEPCADKLRQFGHDGGTQLLDKPPEGPGSSPQTMAPGTEGWAALGVYPRA